MESQGRSKEKYENNAKVAWYSIICMIILLIVITLFSGCSTVKKVDNCCNKKESIK